MLNSSTLLILFFSLATSLQAKGKSHKAHVHGSGKMNIVIEGNQLIAELEAPAHDIVGFEHKPSNEKQEKIVKSAINTLSETESIIELPSEARCKTLKKPLATSDLLKENKSEHSEFYVKYIFDCKNIQGLSSLNLIVFKKFKGLKIIKAQAVTPNGQLSKKLTPDSPVFDLKI